MKAYKYLKQFSFLLFLAIILIGCEYEPPGPPPVINQAPVVSGLNDISLPLNFGTYELDFANYFSDQEGEIITYLVSNSNDTVITVSLTNSVLTISEAGSGTTVINVSATDGHEGHDIDTSFSITVQGIWGAEDYPGNATAGFLDFNGFGEGHIFDNPIPGFKVEGWDYDWESPSPNVELANNDHLLITIDVPRQWYWIDFKLDAEGDFTGKKLSFDYSYFTAPALTGTHWDEDGDLSAVDIRLWYVNGGWSVGGAILFSSLGLEYSTSWQTVEIPLEEFEIFWDMPVDPSKIRYYGLEVWGGTSSAPLSFRIDNFGIVN